MTQIYDLSNPANPVFIRNWGVVGQEPGSTGPIPQDVHGAISIGPKGIRGVTERVYFGHGTGSDGILQIVDRKKLLDPAANGCPPSPNFRTNPTEDDLLCPQLGRHVHLAYHGRTYRLPSASTAGAIVGRASAEFDA